MDISKLDKNMAIKEPGKNLYWYDAGKLTIEGKGWKDTESAYCRLPLKAKKVVRSPIWELSRNSAGICIRFSTDSSSLSVRWDGVNAMDHMTAVGVSGLDLYVKHAGRWKWLAVGRPTRKENESQLFTDLPVRKRDFMLYLPLYNHVSRIELGIPGDFTLVPSMPRKEKPIVFYGTSITQGGCASRPGMCYTAILGRWLNAPVINLGFSGNGVMEPEVIDLLCELDPAAYVLDNMPNMEVKGIREREEAAIVKLRNSHPEVPVILVNNILYCDAYLNKGNMRRFLSSNREQRKIYGKLVRNGMENLHLFSSEGLLGDDGEATVDGVHLTDLGYMRFSEKLIGPLKKILGKCDQLR